MSAQAHILPNEKELFAGAAEGNQAAFTAIYDHYMPRIYAYLIKYTKSETLAQDITQDVFTKLWVNRAELANIHSHASYIFTTAFRFSVSYYRKTERERNLNNNYYNSSPTESNVTEETIEYNESNHLLQLAIDQMPPQRRLIYKLSKEDGLSYDEIAERLNLSRNTVKNTLVEASQSVRKFMEENAIAVLAFFIS
jgi:RNA polymerase sigma-70 factor (family 1)